MVTARLNALPEHHHSISVRLEDRRMGWDVNLQLVRELRPEEELFLRGRPVLHVRSVRVETEADHVVERNPVSRRQEVEVRKL